MCVCVCVLSWIDVINGQFWPFRSNTNQTLFSFLFFLSQMETLKMNSYPFMPSTRPMHVLSRQILLFISFLFSQLIFSFPFCVQIFCTTFLYLLFGCYFIYVYSRTELTNLSHCFDSHWQSVKLVRWCLSALCDSFLRSSSVVPFLALALYLGAQSLIEFRKNCFHSYS